jgi:hypothetical protein
MSTRRSMSLDGSHLRVLRGAARRTGRRTFPCGRSLALARTSYGAGNDERGRHAQGVARPRGCRAHEDEAAVASCRCHAPGVAGLRQVPSYAFTCGLGEVGTGGDRAPGPHRARRTRRGGTRGGRLEFLAWQGEPEVRTACTPKGELPLESLVLSSWQAIELPRLWDDPVRKPDPLPDKQLREMFPRESRAPRVDGGH